MDMWAKLACTGLVFLVVFGGLMFLAYDLLPERAFKLCTILLCSSIVVFVVSALGKVLTVIWL